MYSKKVMELFKDPKNMGEIEDADGIGKVGNPTCGDLMWVYIKVGKRGGKEILEDVRVKTFGCLPPEEKVVVPTGGWEDISSLRVNDNVVVGNGLEGTVAKVYEIDYAGKILNIVPFVSPYNSFWVTPEHPLLCIKRRDLKRTRSQQPNSKWLRIDEKELISTEPRYVKAGRLEEGDFLVFSYNLEVKDDKELDKNLMRLLGYYLSEGYAIAKDSAVAFAFNKKEKKLINEVKKLIEKIIGKKCSQRTRNNVTEVYVCSRKFVRLLVSLGGKYAKQKKLSPKVMLLPPEKQMEILSTFLLGDGDSTKRRVHNTPTFRLATASEELAIQLQEMLARNQIFSSIIVRQRKETQIEGRDITGSELYIVSYKKSRKHKFVRKRQNQFLVPIKKIKRQKYTGPVYNLHMSSEPESFLVKGFVAHNCVAAIATSSQLTVMAKGKTLDEALEITRQEIADEVGGLPPIKVHCSVLAADGLKKAIEDYRSKAKAK